MQAYSIELDHLPDHIRTFILSEEYFDFLFSLHEKYNLSEEQDAALVQLIADLYEKRLTIEGIHDALLAKVKCGSETAKQLIKEIFVNIILPLRDYYGDWREYFFSTIGTQKDVEASKTMPVIFRMAQEVIEPRVNALETVDYDQEALNVKEIFRRQLIDLNYAPDDDYKIALNGLIFDLLARKTAYHLELIGEILENEETIGENKIVRDGMHYAPETTEWIRDLHAFSSPDDITTLSIAKYISQNRNVLHLNEKDKRALKRLFETYRILRHFPESLTKTPRDQWMIIPYDAQQIPGGVFSPTLPPEEVIEGKVSPESFLSQIQISRVSSGAVSLPQALESAVLSSESQAPVVRTLESPSSMPSVVKSPLSLVSTGQAGARVQEDAPKSSESPAPALALVEIPEQHVIEPLPSMPTIIPSSTSMPSADYNVQVEEIIKKAGLSITDESLLSRLRTILVTRLRNVRNDTQTKLRLMDPVSEGGVALSEGQAENILNQVTGYRDQDLMEKPKEEPILSTTGIPTFEGMTSAQIEGMTEEIKKGDHSIDDEKVARHSEVQAEESRTLGTPQPSGSFLPTLPDRQAGGQEGADAQNDKKKKSSNGRYGIMTTPPPLAIQDVDGVPTIVEQGQGSRVKGTAVQSPAVILSETKNPEDTASGKPSRSFLPTLPDRQAGGQAGADAQDDKKFPTMMGGAKKIPIKMGPTRAGGKVSMADVRTPPRLMDIVEELRFMTLKDFRRLSSQPGEAIQKILQKIQLLEKESYTRKMAGIQAWKENEIAKLYLQIGQESFGKGQSIGAVIDQRKAADQSYLTAEEFDALLDLNEELR